MQPKQTRVTSKNHNKALIGAMLKEYEKEREEKMQHETKLTELLHSNSGTNCSDESVAANAIPAFNNDIVDTTNNTVYMIDNNQLVPMTASTFTQLATVPGSVDHNASYAGNTHGGIIQYCYHGKQTNN